MKKRIVSTLLALCMLLCLMPTAAFAEGSTENPPVCSCETACTAESMNTDCPVCGAEGADPKNCKCATVESEQKAAPVSTSSFPSDELVDPMIRIIPGEYGYPAQSGTLTAADFFQPGKAPANAKITAIAPPNAPAILDSISVDNDGTLSYKKKVVQQIELKQRPIPSPSPAMTTRLFPLC